MFSSTYYQGGRGPSECGCGGQCWNSCSQKIPQWPCGSSLYRSFFEYPPIKGFLIRSRSGPVLGGAEKLSQAVLMAVPGRRRVISPLPPPPPAIPGAGDSMPLYSASNRHRRVPAEGIGHPGRSPRGGAGGSSPTFLTQRSLAMGGTSSLPLGPWVW